MTIRDFFLNLFLDSLRVPTDTLKDLVDVADADQDGFITIRELYAMYRKWKNGENN